MVRPAGRIRERMTDITTLTVGQADALAHIIDRLRPYGFDPDGLGPYTPTLHAEHAPSGRIHFWLDSDEGVASGSLDAAGHGVWWLRRTTTVRCHTL